MLFIMLCLGALGVINNPRNTLNSFCDLILCFLFYVILVIFIGLLRIK